MEYAVVEIRGKQYIVEKGTHIKIDGTEEIDGKDKVFDKVLLSVTDGAVEVGTPYLDRQVMGKAIENINSAKKKGVKYQPGGNRTQISHRSQQTIVEIIDIK